MTDLTFEDVSIRYGSRRSDPEAVSGVRLKVPSGSTVGLVGESGSGKSSLARAAAGLVPISTGQILCGETLISKGGRRRTRPNPVVQMVFQDASAALNPRMTIGESLLEAVSATPSISSRGRRAEVDRLLGLVHLHPEHGKRLPREMSGGQRQRAALARSIGARPEVIIADEVTSALDVSVQGAILNLLRELQDSMNLTMLFISHNLAAVRYVSDHIVVMQGGRMVDEGPAETLLTTSPVPYTRSLVGAVLSVPRTPRIPTFAP